MSKKIQAMRSRNKKTFLCAVVLTALACWGLYTPDAYGVNKNVRELGLAFINSGYYVSGFSSNYTFNVSGVSTGADTLYVRSQSSDAFSAMEEYEGVFGSLARDGSNARPLPEPGKNDEVKPSEVGSSGLFRTASFQTYYYAFNGKTSIDNGIVDVDVYNSDDYRQSRIGGVGFVSWKDRQGSGITLHAGYGRGHMSQSFDSSHEFGVLGDFAEEEYIEAKIRLTDFQFGVTFDKQLDNGVIASLTLDGGAQDYGWSRDQRQVKTSENDPLEQVYQAALTGNTFKASFALMKEFDFHNGWTMRPTASIESANSWIFTATESGIDHSGEIADKGMKEIWKPWGLTDAVTYSRNMARVGSSLTYNEDVFGIGMKAFYATQLGGRSAPFASITNGEKIVSAEGDGFGRDCLNVGAQTWFALDSAKRSNLSGSYDVFCYKRGVGQTISAIFNTSF